MYGTLPNYQRILSHGGVASPADAALVGDEDSVTKQVEALFAAMRVEKPTKMQNLIWML